MPKPDAPASFFSRFKGWIVGLTSVLVVLPALINTGHDIYSSLLKLPRTEAERINERLFREYFKKQPVATIPVPIKQNNGTVEVRFAIYEKGDVFVEFGNFTQWFPFPARDGEDNKTLGFSLISSAFAQSPPAPKGEGRFQQADQIQGDALIREKTYENGVVEKQVIDPRSGDILNSSARQTDQKQVAVPASRALPVPKMATIDLDQLRKVAQTGPASAAPVAAPAPSWHEALKAGLAWCQRKSNFLSRNLCEYREKKSHCEPENRWGTVAECDK